MLESLQNYIALITGASKASREKARATAHGLLAQAGLEDAANDAQERVSKLADDILNASRANREMLEQLVGAELEKAATRLGFARAERVDELAQQLADLRAEVDSLRAPVTPARAARPPRAEKVGTDDAGPAAPTVASPRFPDAPPKKAAKKSPVKKSPAKKAAAKKSPAAKAAARKSPAEQAAKRVSPAERAAKRAAAAGEPGVDA